VVLITDGLIGFEQEIIGSILSLLPGGARLHTVGVGSSVNRSLTAAAARAGRGIEVVLGLGEDPDRAAHRLRAHSETPLVVDVEASGDALLATAPIKIPDLFAGAPILLSARVLARGGEIVLKGKTADGVWVEKIRAPRAEANSGSDAVVTLFGRELVEDAEMKIAAGLDKRMLDASIEATGIAYRISTRLTSWIAIDKDASVDPRDPSRRVEQPQMLPYGVTAEGVGLRGANIPFAAPPMHSFGAMAPRAAMAPSRVRSLGGAMPPPGGAPQRPAPAPQAPPAEELAKKKGASDAPAREDRTLVGRIKDALFGSDDDLDEEVSPITARGAWVGRITLRSSGEVVIEFTASADFDFQPGNVSIVFEAGGASPARLDVLRSTRSGSISAGSTIRIVLGFSPSFDSSIITAIEIKMAERPSGPLVIQIGN
jgi:Ca-activated chloride channel family protein